MHDHVCSVVYICTALLILYSEKVRSTCLERGEKISCSHEILRFNGVHVFQHVLYPLFYRLDKELRELELINSIKHRWTPSDSAYIEAQKVFSKERSEQVVKSLWAALSRWMFLLKLKAKYAGMYRCKHDCSIYIELYCDVIIYFLCYCVYNCPYNNVLCRWSENRKEAFHSNI